MLTSISRCCLLVATSLACIAQEPSVSGTLARLRDTPVASFQTSGWSHTNTSNPFILTPDVLTNAMIGVSRLAKGAPFLRGSAVVPTTLDVDSILSAMKTRLSGKRDPIISVEEITGRKVVVAKYGEGDKETMEYAFEFHGYLAHVILVAKTGDYYKRGEKVAKGIVESFT